MHWLQDNWKWIAVIVADVGLGALPHIAKSQDTWWGNLLTSIFRDVIGAYKGKPDA